MSLFETHLRHDASGRPVLAVAGDLDLASASKLTDTALGLGDLADNDLRVDLSGVTFLDSTGLGALLELRKHAVAAGHELIIDQRSSAVQRVLDLAGLSDMFGDSGTQA